MDENENQPAEATSPERSLREFDARVLAKYLLRTVKVGALATITSPAGDPFASLTSIATDYDGSPILLTSSLSGHSRNMKADARVSLLLAKGGKGDPLAHPRLTILGTANEETNPPRRAKLKARFLARHPKASLYADFGDFSFWKIAASGAHLNGGFARAADFSGAEVLTDIANAQDLINAETGALAHLNADHAETLALYAEKLAGTRAARWRAVGLDPEGLDLAAGDRAARILFPCRVTTAADLRRVLVDLAETARAL